MKRDLIAGLTMALIGAGIIFLLIPYGVVEPKKVKFAALSPSYYPRIVAIVLLILGVSITIRSILANRLNAHVNQAPVDQHPDAMLRTVGIFVILVFYAATAGWLGFILSSFFALLSAFRLAGEKRWPLAISLAIGLPVALYFFFLKVAGIPIPTGLLEPLLVGA